MTDGTQDDGGAPAPLDAPPEPADGAGRLWSFSSRLYARPGVEDAALTLQDEHGLDVNMLLLCCFLGAHGVRANRETVAALDQHARAWQAVTVEPLRQLRRRLKRDVGAVTAEAADPLRQQVKALELEAEKLQQETLYRTLERLAGKDGREAERAGLMRVNLSLYLDQAEVARDADTRAHLEALVAAAVAMLTGADNDDAAEAPEDGRADDGGGDGDA